MNKPHDHPLQLLTWTSGLAIILFCLTGVASMMGWIPASLDSSTGTLIRQEMAARDGMSVQLECKNCGVVAATCVLDTANDDYFMDGLVSSSGVLGPGLVDAVAGEASTPPTDRKVGRHYETTVRFNNGTMRAFTDKGPPKWQVGQRVRVTEGIIQPQS